MVNPLSKSTIEHSLKIKIGHSWVNSTLFPPSYESQLGDDHLRVLLLSCVRLRLTYPTFKSSTSGVFDSVDRGCRERHNSPSTV